MSHIDLSRFQSAFVEEARDLLRGLEGDLLRLERSPTDAEILARIFRALRALKGSAGMYGFPQIAAFAGMLDALLQPVKEKTIGVSEDIINIALQSGDLMYEYLNSDISDAEFKAASGDLESQCRHMLRAQTSPPGNDAGSTTGNRKTALPGDREHPPDRPAISVEIESLEALLRDLEDSLSLLSELDPQGSHNLQAKLLAARDRASGLLIRPVSDLIDRLRADLRETRHDGIPEPSIRAIGVSTEFDSRLLQQLADPLEHVLRSWKAGADGESTGMEGEGGFFIQAGSSGGKRYIRLSRTGAAPEDPAQIPAIEQISQTVQVLGGSLEFAENTDGSSELLLSFPARES
jgi:chemotaxis protein histidine kinase CheA